MNKKASSKGGGAAMLRRSPRFQAVVCSLLLCALCPPLQTQANPHGGVVVHGDVQIGAGSGGNLQILQNSQNAIIDWQGFSISAGELTQFLQPGSSAAVLNRVTGGDPSAIHGALQANGNVFLINPSGILVGPSGSIDVHGLVLSTLDVDNGEFLARGDMVFKGGSDKGVTNLGRINAIGGDVFLIGRTITNSGSVKASQGRVGLAAGEEVLLKADTGLEGERVFVRATGSGASGTGILNDGTIEGAAVELKAHGNLYALAINNKGSVRATGAESSGGRVFLRGAGGSISNSGSIRATGGGAGSGGRVLIEAAYAKVDGQIKAEDGTVRIAATEKADLGGSIDVSSSTSSTGGSVVVEAREIAVGSTAQIDASGATGGGSIRIGGGFQGRDASIRNAESLVIDDGATLRADALASGNGGQVILWSDGDTTFRGDISAQALGNTGNGGFVEVSGKEGLLFDGTVSTLAASGANGTLLLDPRNLTISTAATTLTNLNNGTLAGLVVNNHVVVSTFDPGNTTDAGHITVLGSVIYTSDNSLTLLAEGDIYVGNHIINRGAGDVNLVAGWDPSVTSLNDFFGGSPGTPHPTLPGTSTVGGAPDMDSLIFGTDGSFGKNGGSVYVGLIDHPGSDPSLVAADLAVSVASRTGQTNVAGYDVNVWGPALTGGTNQGAQRYAQIGYNSRTAGTTAADPVTGRIRVKAVNDVSVVANKHDVGLLGRNPAGWDASTDNTGNASYAQIGHGGDREAVRGMKLSGEIIVEAGNDVILLGGKTWNNHAQIGHGGFDNVVANYSATLGGNILVRAGRDVTVRGGQGNYSHAQIGHGAVQQLLAGFAESTIGVYAGRNVTVQGGAGTPGAENSSQARAQIGHGALASDFVDAGGTVLAPGSGKGFKGAVTVDAGGAILIQAGDYDSDNFALVGHGGNGSDGDHGGNVTVTAGTGLQLLGGTGADYLFAQIGHLSIVSGNSISGEVRVTVENGSVLLKGGGSAVGHAAIGSSGYNILAGSTISGGTYLTLKGTDPTDGLSMLAGDGSHSAAHIGHLAQFTADKTVPINLSGDVMVDIAAGGLRMQSSTLGTNAHTQIGHGGSYATGSKSGDIRVTVTSGNLSAKAGGTTSGERYNYTQIGHGGYIRAGAVTASSGTGSEDILDGDGNVVGQRPLGIVVRVLDGDIELLAGGATANYAQIGHGGIRASVAGTSGYTGDITVEASGSITMGKGGASYSHAKIGHGGTDTVTGNVTNASGSIVVRSGADLAMGEGTAGYAYAQIGHGGPGVVTGNVWHLGGAIDVTAGGSVIAKGGTAGYSNVQIGHGGYISAALSTIGISTIAASPITVKATTGDVLLLSGTASNAGAKIGHGGYNMKLASFGESHVTVEAGRHVRLVSPQSETFLNVSNSGTQIGHGGFGAVVGAVSGASTLGYSGDISVTAGGKLDLIAGKNAGSYNWAQLGHNSYYNSNGVHSGNITVTTGTLAGLAPADYGITIRAAYGDYMPLATTNTTAGYYYSFASIGHRGHSNDTSLYTTGLHGDILVDAVRGGILVVGGDGVDGSNAADTPPDIRLNGASIGHGGYNAGHLVSGISGSVSVFAEGDIVLRSGTSRHAAVMIGHGGYIAFGPMEGDIKVVSRNGSLELDSTLTINAARGGVMIGHGAPSPGSGTRKGDILVDVAGEISMVATVASLSHIGHKSSTANAVSNSDLTIRARSFDRATGDSGSQLFRLDAGLGTMLAASLGWGRLSLVGMGSQGIEMAGAMSWNSAYDFNLLSYSGIRIGSLIANSGSGEINVVAGWDPSKASLHTAGDFPSPGPSAPVAPWRYYMIRDVNAATDLIGVADAYGNGNAGVVVGSTTTASVIGSVGGTTTVLGHSVEVLGGTAANAYALIGTQPVAGLTRTGAITVMANGGGVAVRGGGLANTYAGIGHRSLGGTTSAINSIIRVESLAGLSLRGGAGQLSSAQIGHAGASGVVGTVGGAINLKAATDIELIGGNGAQAYAQIGHGGSGTSGTLSGDVTIDGVRNVTLSGGGSHAYAQIGHGGASGVDPTINLASAQDPSFAKRSLSASGTIQVINTTGAVSMTGGGAGTHSAYTQIGHGGVAISSGGTIGGNVTVEAGAGGIDIKGGLGNIAYALIGSGGYAIDSNVGGTVTVAAKGTGAGDGIRMRGGDGDHVYGPPRSGFAGAMIGNSRYSPGVATTAVGGDTFVTVKNGGLSMLAGDGYYSNAQIGHSSSGGGTGAAGASTGLVDVHVEGGQIYLEGGNKNLFSFAQIGHGGWDNRDHGGNIDVKADAGDIVIKGGTVGNYNHAKIGHGGYGNAATLQINSGTVTVEATVGSVSLESRSGTFGFTQIGHGGLGKNDFMRGEYHDAVTVIAGNQVKLAAGGGQDAFAMIGHGGTNARGIYSGAVNVTAGAGGLVMAGGAGARAFTQVGHGGYNEAGAAGVYTITGAAVTVNAGRVDMKGGGGNAYAQIGHGGFYVNGSVSGSAVSVTTTGTAATDGVKLKGGTGSYSYAMIGSGGYGDAAGTNGVFDAAGNVTVTSAGGGIALEGTVSNAFALIGNGGHQVAGALSGTTTVISNGGTASDGVSLKGGTGGYSFANIGHATNNVTGSMLNSDTVVTIAGGGLDLRAGSNTLAVAAIGLQSRQFVGDRSGKVDVTVSKGNVTMTAGTGTAAFVQLGHGGWGQNGSGSMTGEVKLTVSDGTLTMTGGDVSAADYGKFAMIGHGGGAVHTGAMSGSVTVDVKDAIAMQGGAGGDSFTQIGHGGRQRSGTIGLANELVKVVSREGGISMASGDGGNAFSMIGHGGIGVSGSVVGSVEVEAGDAIAMTAGGGASAFAQIGHGGYGYIGALGTTGNSIKVTSRTAGLAMTNGTGASAFAMIGMGGHNSTGNRIGNITVQTVTGVAMNATRNAGVGTSNYSFVQIGHGGYNTAANAGTLDGNVSVTSSGSGAAVSLLGGKELGQHAMIGHGGYGRTGAKTGEITVSAGSGGIVLKGGGDSTAGSTTQPQGFAQIGHGGSASAASASGAINVTTTNGGDVILHGGGRQYSHAQIGHGGRSSVSGLQNGAITVTSAGKVELRGAVYTDTGASSTGANETWAQIGHGGMFAGSTFGGAITVNAQTGVLLESGASDYARAQIGHGGYGAGTNAGVGVEMVNAAVTVTTVSGGVILDATKANGKIFATAMIGHGGTSLYNGGRNGAFRGDITVNGGTGNVELHSGGRTGSGAMIGNGGTWLSGNHSGRISVSAGGDLIMDMRTGGSSNNYSRIGHGGVGTDSAGADQPMSGNMSGDICVQIGGKVLLDATGGSTLENKYVQIGHGGSNVVGNFDGNITVVARGLGGIELKGGAGTGAYAQIGHGGRNTNGDMTGNVYVVAENGDIKLAGGSGAASYAMLGHGDGARTSLGKRGGGMHIFAQGNLTGTGGTGAANQGNVHIFHQNSNGLQSADYIAGSGDGYQKVVNGTISLPGYVTADESTMISGNLGYGLVQILDSSATDYIINAPDMLVDTAADFYLVTGGNITMLSSYQNSGTGSVTLVAGWNGVGGSVGPGSVTYASNGMGGFNYCKPIISQGALTGIDFNDCAVSGNNGKTLTIGSAAQTLGVAVGSRYGANTFAAYGIVLRAGNTDGAYTQLGYRPTATAGGADSSIALRVKQGGLTLTAGTGVSDSYVQIGHGGTGAANSILNGAISVTFCAPGDVILDAGAGAAGRGSYAQIGHGGNAWRMAKSGAITIDGAKDVILRAGREDAYAQIGHGGAKDAAETYGIGAANGAVSVINTTGKVGLYGGSGTNATAQIGHGGVALRAVMDGPITVDAGTGGIELKGGTGTRSYVLIGNGGYNIDNTIGGDVTVNAKGTAATDGIVMIGGGSGTHAGAFIGNGVYENNSATSVTIGGDTKVTVVNGGLSMTGGTGTASNVGIGHANRNADRTELSTQTGNVDVEIAEGGLSMTGGLGQHSGAQIGHGGIWGDRTTSGNIKVTVDKGNISLKASAGTSSENFSYAQIGHGGWESGTKTGTVAVNAKAGSILVEGGMGDTATGTYNFARIGHGGYGNNSTLNVVNQAITVTASGSVTVRAGRSYASFAQIGHGGLGRNSFMSGGVSGAIEVKAIGGAIVVEAGSRDFTHAQIGHGGSGVRAPQSGNILVESGTGGIQIKGGSALQTYAMIGNGGHDVDQQIGGDVTVKAKGTATTDGIVMTGGSGTYAGAFIGNGIYLNNAAISGFTDVSVVNGGIAMTGGGGTSSKAGIGHSNNTDNNTMTGYVKVYITEGDLTMIGGGGSYASATIGHEKAEGTATMTGAVDVEARKGNISVTGGLGQYSYAIIGHGGRGGTATSDGNVTVIAGDGNITVTGGNSTVGTSFAVARIGHGVWDSGNKTGVITVTAEKGNIVVQGGTATAGNYNFAQIGHGGYGNGSTQNIVNQAINVTATLGSVTVKGGTTDANFAQIGHGGLGRNSFFLGSFSGDVTVRAGNAITLTGGNAGNTHALIGNGGSGMRGAISGNVLVEAGTGGISLSGGTGTNAFAAIGNGGQDNDKSISGTTTVTALGTNAATDGIRLKGGTGSQAAAHIGHLHTTGTVAVSGSIEVGGSVEVTTAAGNISLEGGGANSHAQIGHGGIMTAAGMSVAFSGKVDVRAAQDVSLKGGAADTSYAQIGHGGRRISGAALASVGGAVDASAIYVKAGRDVLLSGGIRANSGAKIGHGHNSQTMSSFVENKITVDADRNVELVAAQFDVFTNTGSSGTQIGHGGTGATVDGGNSGYKGDIFVNAGGKLDLIAGKNAVSYNYALIGHTAYYNVRGNHSGNITVKTGLVAGLAEYGINIVAANRSDANASSSYYSFAGIGHHGHSNGAGGGNLEGNITVIAERGGLRLKGGDQAVNNAEVRLHAAQIGHGDYNSDGLKIGDIKLCIEGDILLENGNSRQSPVQIGHGGFSHDGNITGSIEVTSRNGSIVLDSSVGNIDIADTQIGHGGHTTTGTFDGNISVSAAGDIRLVGGRQTATYSQIGHGGTTSTGNFSGNVHLMAGGDLRLVGGSHIGGYAMVGHGTATTLTTGTRSGAMKLFVGGATVLTDNVSGTRLGHGTSTVGGIVNAGITLATGTLDLSGHARGVTGIANEMGQSGAVAFVVHDGDLLVDGAGARFNHGFDASFVASGNVVMASSVQNSGSGNVGVAAGWDAQAGYDAATGEFDGSNGLTLTLAPGECRLMQTLEFDFATLAAGPGLWGNNGGTATIGGGAQTAGVAVGSARGTTTVFGDAVKVLGSDTTGSGYALVGFAPTAGVSPVGDITVLAKGGGVAVEGGDAAIAYAQIGHRALGSIVPDLSGNILVESLGGLSLRGGVGVLSSAQIGHGGNSGDVNSIRGTVTVKVAANIDAVGGSGGGAYSQIGHGGLLAKGDMGNSIEVEAGGDILLSAPSLAGLAYAKIGHGDDVRGGGGGDGNREGDIVLTAGGTIEMQSALVGHVNGSSSATAAAGYHTWIGAARTAPEDPAAGSLVADAASEFSGAEEVRFYLPRRANNQVAAGAKINGETYDGGVDDPWPVQREDEFTNHIVYEDGSMTSPAEHGNVLGDGPVLTVAGLYAFHYDLIEIGTPPVVVVPVDPGSGGSGGGWTVRRDPDYRRMVPDDRTHDKWRRDQEKEYSRWGDYGIYYEGYSQYGLHGESVYQWERERGGEGE